MAKRGEQLRISTNFSGPTGGPPTSAIFSPSLPTAIPQHHLHPLQTPMQSFFNPSMPAAPPRPTHHHQNQPSIQLAAAGIHNYPTNYITPVTGHFPRPSMALAQSPQPPSAHPFPGRSRRQLSIGGPPKALLGGPARKLSPLPPATNPSATASGAPEKKKKVIVNLPNETIHGEHENSPVTRPDWARSPLPNVFADVPVNPVEASTTAIYPPDEWRIELPNSIDVYLPGKVLSFHLLLVRFINSLTRLHGKLSNEKTLK